MHKIIARTLIYHWLILCFGLSLGFIFNAVWVGYKSILVEKAISNIFFPLDFTEEMEEKVKSKAREMIQIELNHPNEFEVLGEVVYYNDEFYWCRYKYRDDEGRLRFDETITRVRWKTWERYYETEVIDTEDKAARMIEKVNKWHAKICEAIRTAEEKEKKLISEELMSTTHGS